MPHMRGSGGMKAGKSFGWDDDGDGDDTGSPDRERFGCAVEISPEAFMEELCTQSGGYGRFFRTLALQFFIWHVAVVAVPAFFLDHHRCESTQPFYAWLMYAAVVVAMVTLAVLLELSVVQGIGAAQPDARPKVAGALSRDCPVEARHVHRRGVHLRRSRLRVFALVGVAC